MSKVIFNFFHSSFLTYLEQLRAQNIICTCLLSLSDSLVLIYKINQIYQSAEFNYSKMLGRAATRIELNRDSDMEELEQERNRRIQEHERQMLNQHAPFGQRIGSRIPHNHSHQQQHHVQPQPSFVHSIFTNDSSSSGLGNHSIVQMPNFQPHNLVGAEIQDQARTPVVNSNYGTSMASDNSNNSLLIYGVGPPQTHSHTPGARPSLQHRPPQASGGQTQTYLSQQMNYHMSQQSHGGSGF